MNPILKARLEREHDEKEKLFNDITYGNLPLPVRKAIFEKAWELGHSSGPNEVEYFYNDLTELQEKIQALYEEQRTDGWKMEKDGLTKIWKRND